MKKIPKKNKKNRIHVEDSTQKKFKRKAKKTNGKKLSDVSETPSVNPYKDLTKRYYYNLAKSTTYLRSLDNDSILVQIGEASEYENQIIQGYHGFSKIYLRVFLEIKKNH